MNLATLIRTLTETETDHCQCGRYATCLECLMYADSVSTYVRSPASSAEILAILSEGNSNDA
jgi:hypothetical protein